MTRHLLQYNGRVIHVTVSQLPDRVAVNLWTSEPRETTNAEYIIIYEWFRPILQQVWEGNRHVHVTDPQHVLTT